MKLLKILFLSTLIFAVAPCVYADDNNGDGQLPIEIKPISTGDPSIPKVPSYIRLSARVDRDGMTIISNVDVMAQVQITVDTGAVYFDSMVALAPSCRCSVPVTGEGLTVCVTIGDRQYVGYTYPY